MKKILLILLGLLILFIAFSLYQNAYGPYAVRPKGYDAIIKANLANIRAEAAIFKEQNKSYKYLCASSPTTDMLTEIEENNGKKTIKCHSDGDSFVVASPLKNPGYWCVDSLGTSQEINEAQFTYIQNSDTLCLESKLDENTSSREINLTDPKLTLEFPSQFNIEKTSYWDGNNIPIYRFEQVSDDHYINPPYFSYITFFTEKNLKDWIQNCTGDCLVYADEAPDPEGDLQQFYEDKKMFESDKAAQKKSFNGRAWISSPIENCVGDSCVLKSYKTFIGDTEVEIELIGWPPDAYSDEQADTIFSSFKIK
jgi:hypothetical protein